MLLPGDGGPRAERQVPTLIRYQVILLAVFSFFIIIVFSLHVVDYHLHQMGIMDFAYFPLPRTSLIIDFVWSTALVSFH
jgi:hypothetical protein